MCWPPEVKRRKARSVLGWGIRPEMGVTVGVYSDGSLAGLVADRVYSDGPPAGLVADGVYSAGPPAGFRVYRDGPRRDWLQTGCTVMGPRRDWLRTGCTVMGPRRDWLRTGCTLTGPRRDWLQTGCPFLFQNFLGPCSKIRPDGSQLQNLFWKTKKKQFLKQL